MIEPLLPFYDRELEFFRQMSVEFAKRFPKIAARLSLDSTGSQDPHVERMIQAFALMNARIRHKLDDDFPELAEAILNVLYPHYIAPIPSMAMVQFIHDRKQGDLTSGSHIPSGTILEADRIDGERCTYRTAYPVTLWPINVQSAAFAPRPFAAPLTAQSGYAQSLVSIQLKTLSPAVTFRALAPATLRFHLALPQFRQATTLYELLFAGLVEVALASSPEDPNPVILGPRALRPVGFDREEGLLPYGPRSFRGYRLLSEYFVFPQKFLFFDLVGLTAAHWEKFADRVGIYIYLKAENEELARFVSADALRLGCTPIVNLFSQTADPLHLSQRQTEYRVVPDARRDAALEIYSVDRVVASSPRGDEFEYAPFYSFRHGGSGDQRTFWHSVRRARTSEQGGADVEGTDVYLTLVDLNFLPKAPADLTLHLETTCINRGSPNQLVSREGRIRFRFSEGAGPVSDVICLAAPTQTGYPQIRRMLIWRLISHLSLNHLSLHVEDTDASALQEILRLYDPLASRDTRDMIDGIQKVNWSRGVARVGGAAGGFCRGLDAEILLDEQKFTGSSPYLFATVLSHFFGLYVSVNSFSRVKARVERSRGEGASWTWPPQAGERQLL